MKKLNLIFILLFVGDCVFSQISTTRMNDLRLEMKLSEVEQVIKKPIELSKNDTEWGYVATIDYNGSIIKLIFSEFSDENGNISFRLNQLETTSTKIKTLSKLGIGNSIDDLWKAYKNYTVSVWKEWDMQTEKYSETNRIFQLIDTDAGTVLNFFLQNNKVYKITLGYNEGC